MKDLVVLCATVEDKDKVMLRERLTKLSTRQASKKKGPMFLINGYELLMAKYRAGMCKWSFDHKIPGWKDKEMATIRGNEINSIQITYGFSQKMFKKNLGC